MFMLIVDCNHFMTNVYLIAYSKRKKGNFLGWARLQSKSVHFYLWTSISCYQLI